MRSERQTISYYYIVHLLKEHFPIETDTSERDFDAFETKYEKIKHENLSMIVGQTNLFDPIPPLIWFVI